MYWAPIVAIDPPPERWNGCVNNEDLNGDGAREPGEPGLGGWTIELAYNGGVDRPGRWVCVHAGCRPSADQCGHVHRDGAPAAGLGAGVTLTLSDGVFTTDPDLTAIGGAFAIVKTVTVAECGTTVIAPVFVTSQPGKITGGIRILVPGGIATGGFEFMQRNDGPRGTLEFNDHVRDVRIHTSDITGISVSSSGTEAYVFGHATVGATAYAFRLHLVDAGEPGTNDQFELILANGYTAGFGEVLDGGNVQIH